MRVDAEFTASVRLAGKMTMIRSAAVCALLMAPATAGAQQVAAADLPAPQAAAAEGKACFQPRALPVCRSFWVTEFGVQLFLSQPPGINDQRRVMGTWELGWMKNRSSGDAVGASVFLSTNDNAMRSGVRARYRRWLGSESAVDVSPALIVFQSSDDLETHARLGAALQAGVTFHDWIGLTSQVEAAQGGVRIQTGVRVGGYPGLVTGVGAPLLALWGALHDDS
jgi:hypothetical protein